MLQDRIRETHPLDRDLEQGRDRVPGEDVLSFHGSRLSLSSQVEHGIPIVVAFLRRRRRRREGLQDIRKIEGPGG